MGDWFGPLTRIANDCKALIGIMAKPKAAIRSCFRFGDLGNYSHVRRQGFQKSRLLQETATAGIPSQEAHGFKTTY